MIIESKKPQTHKNGLNFGFYFWSDKIITLLIKTFKKGFKMLLNAIFNIF